MFSVNVAELYWLLDLNLKLSSKHSYILATYGGLLVQIILYLLKPKGEEGEGGAVWAPFTVLILSVQTHAVWLTVI
jgi:hypothetical protein